MFLPQPFALHRTAKSMRWRWKTCATASTPQLLRLIDRLDACLLQLGGTTAIRDELLRLHAMALTIIEGIALTVPAESACIWAEAESLQTDLEALVAWARTAQLIIAPLINLAPQHEA